MTSMDTADKDRQWLFCLRSPAARASALHRAVRAEPSWPPTSPEPSTATPWTDARLGLLKEVLTRGVKILDEAHGWAEGVPRDTHDPGTYQRFLGEAGTCAACDFTAICRDRPSTPTLIDHVRP